MESQNIVWCLHCERVRPAAEIVEDGEDEATLACAYSDCDGEEWDLSGWAGPYEDGKVYQMYSDEFMKAMGTPST